MTKTLKCPHCDGDVTITVAELGTTHEGEGASAVAKARGMVDVTHVAPCQDFLADPLGELGG